MNLSKIFEKQRELDEVVRVRSRDIYKGVKTEEIDKLSIVALLIEMSEFMNELETFKYWKKNRKNNQEKIKDELADVLHFAVSWAAYKNINTEINPVLVNQDPNDQYIAIMKSIMVWFDDKSDKSIMKAMELIIGLCELIGFTYEDIEECYLKKNKINFDRMSNNY